MDNFTPLKSKKKSTNSLLIIGNLLLVTIILFSGAFYLVRTKFPYSNKAATTTNIPQSTATPIPTLTKALTPIPTNTLIPTISGPTATLIPLPCGTKACDDLANPCRSGYICVKADDGNNYCSNSDSATACKTDPSFSACCTATGVPTATPTSSSTITPTARTVSLPETGNTQLGVFGIIGTIILVGLLL